MIARRLEVLLAVPALLFLGMLLAMPGDERHVAAPAFACLFLAWALWTALSDRNGEPPVVDVGMLCAVATTLYSVYPLVNYWIDGMQFGILSDTRLYNYDIQPDEIGAFHWRNVTYLASFAAAYYFSGRRGRTGAVPVDPPDGATVRAVLVVFVSLMAFFLVLRIFFGVTYNASYEEGAFGRSQAAVQALPLFLRQVASKFLGILFVAKTWLMCYVVSRSRERRWRWILFGWIAAETVQVLVVKGARTEFVLLSMGAALFYNLMVRRLSSRTMAIAAAALFLFFLFLGLYRTFLDVASLSAGLEESETSVFATGNEFQSLFGTAYDVLQLKEGGTVLPWYLRINDFVNILPPQQLLPFEKVSAAEWYLREIDLSGTGAGFMWGVIAQSIVGFDWIELAIRGALLGFLLARFHLWYSNRRSSFPSTVLYVFLCIKIYYTYRDTTFSLLTNLAWEVLPMWAAVELLRRRHDVRSRPAPGGGEPLAAEARP